MRTGIYSYNKTWSQTSGLNLIEVSNNKEDYENAIYTGGGEWLSIEGNYKIKVLDPNPSFIRELTNNEKEQYGMLFNKELRKKEDNEWLSNSIDTSEYENL